MSKQTSGPSTAADPSKPGPSAKPVPRVDASVRLGWRRALVVAGSVAATCLALQATGLDGWIDRSVARPGEFRLRAALGLGPDLAPHVKVLAFDDEAAAKLGATDLTLAGWGQLLIAIAARQPHQILLDKTFAYPVGVAEAEGFRATLNRLGVPVVVKAHAEPTKLAFATEVEAWRYAVSLTKLVQRDAHHAPPPWVPDTPVHLYGPGGPLAGAFTRVGHDLESEGGSAWVEPLVDAGATLMLPHWTLYAGGEPRLDGQDLVVGGTRVPVDRDGRLTVDLIEPAVCQRHVRSLAPVIDAARRGRPAPGIDPGDTVVILPDQYAGAVDLQKTPLGRMPVGYIHMALVSSAESGKWLSTMPGGSGLILLLAAVAAAMAVRFASERSFTLILLGMASVFAMVGVLAFVLGDIIVPWALPVAAFVVAGGICRVESAYLAERRAALLRHDLHGILSPERLSNLGGSLLEHLEATEQVVTIMFIDIVGFSRAAEKQTPKEAFSSLKRLIDQLRSAVHEHGGVVDRTLGDGMLCVFGYDLVDRGQSALAHAEQAARCAVAIQRVNLQNIAKAHRSNHAVFPLRIGINTTGVYLGNLGDTERTDLTVIGNGVNFAQRLEAACDRHMAMLGASTADLLIDVADIAPMLRKRHIRVKHATELTEAYELDPFYSEPRLLIEGDEAYRQFVGIERSDDRHPVPYPGMIRVMTNYGDGEMINFSLDGFTIKLGEYYAKDVSVSLKMDTADGALGERLEAASLSNLMLEVRWARPAGDAYIHGCLIKNLSAEQRELVYGCLRDAIQRYVQAERRIA